MLDPQLLPYYNPLVTRKTALVTCGVQGIGFYTVLHLYLHGFTVYITTRNRKKAESTIKEIYKEARRRWSPVVEDDLRVGSSRSGQGQMNGCTNGSTNGNGSDNGSNASAYYQDGMNDRYLGELRLIELDLLSLSSVKNCAVTLKGLESTLDVLVLNSQQSIITYNRTQDDFEVQFQSNYLSFFLLTQLLLPIIPKNGRIIYVSSVAHHLELVHFNNDWDFDYEPNYFFTWLRYAKAKTCGIHYMKLLALKNPGLNCFSVSPGLIMNKTLFWTKIPIVGIFLGIFIQLFRWFFCTTYEEGSFSTLYCALSNDVLLEENGGYYVPYGKVAKPSKVAQDLESGSKNWVWTIENLRKRGYTDLD